MDKQKKIENLLNLLNNDINIINNFNKFDMKISLDINNVKDSEEIKEIDIDSILLIIETFKKDNNELFGNIRNYDEFLSIFNNLNLKMYGEEIYKGFKYKSIVLLYNLIKKHPFSDGNKRLSYILFLYYLSLYDFNLALNIDKKRLYLSIMFIAHSLADDYEIVINQIYYNLYYN